MFVYGANVPDGNANAASNPSPSSLKRRKTDRGEKKKDGVTTNNPTPDELRCMDAATMMRLPRSSANSTSFPEASVNFSGCCDLPPIGRMLANTSNGWVNESSNRNGS